MDFPFNIEKFSFLLSIAKLHFLPGIEKLRFLATYYNVCSSVRLNALRIKHDRLVSTSSADASNRQCIIHARVELL